LAKDHLDPLKGTTMNKFRVTRDDRDLHLSGEKYLFHCPEGGVRAILYDRETAQMILEALEGTKGPHRVEFFPPASPVERGR
jgi:hypothetical protein